MNSSANATAAEHQGFERMEEVSCLMKRAAEVK